MSTYVVGDIQGCFDELSQLLSDVNFAERDQLIVAGDLINRGPKNLETLELLRNLSNVKCVLGNHDLHFLAVAKGLKKVSRSDTFQDLLDDEDLAQQIEWLRQQPLLIELPEFKAVVVHAGIPHTWGFNQAKGYAKEVEQVLKSSRLEEFLHAMYGDTPVRFSEDLTGMGRLRVITNHFTRMRFCTSDGSLDLSEKSESAPNGFLPWFSYDRAETTRILFGHWAAISGVTGSDQYVALDTGCVWGNKLSALRLDDNRLFSIPAIKRDNG